MDPGGIGNEFVEAKGEPGPGVGVEKGDTPPIGAAAAPKCGLGEGSEEKELDTYPGIPWLAVVGNADVTGDAGVPVNDPPPIAWVESGLNPAEPGTPTWDVGVGE